MGTFSDEIRDKRVEMGLTQKEFANYCGVCFSTIQNLETFNGGYMGTYPSATTIAKLRKKGIIDLTYNEVIQMIKTDRMIAARRRKGNRK